MKKLFKEVWKSFSKSKIILSGLTILIFLTSGIITLIFDIFRTYNNQYDYYKQTSQLHNITMNGDIKPTGTKPKDLYYTPDDKKVNNVWEYINPKSKSLNYIQVNTSSKYYDISKLVTNVQTPKYVSVDDLSTILNMNLNSLNNISSSTNPDFAQINLDKKSNNILKIYNPDGTAKINEVINIKNIYENNNWNWTWYPIKNVGQIIDNNNKFKSLLVDTQDPEHKAYIWDDVKKTGWFSTTDIYKQYINNPDRFYLINENIISQWFGFSKPSPIANEYVFNSQFNNWIVDEVRPINIDFEDLKSKSIKTNFDINTNDAITSNIDINNHYLKVHETINLNDIAQIMLIPKSWFVYNQEKYIYTNYLFNLSGLENGKIDNSWSGMYANYLQKLINSSEESDKQQFNELSKVSYWIKDIEQTLVDYDGNTIEPVDANGNLTNNSSTSTLKNISLDKNDLIYEIKNKATNDISKISIKENLSPVDINQATAIKLNTNAIPINEAIIESNSLNFAYKQIYAEINEIVGKIGIRENITVNSNENNMTSVFQFINLGNKFNQINWNGINVKQEVGKLSSTNLESPIFNLKSNIDPYIKKVPAKQLPSIIDKLLTGLSLNRKFINPMISFESFSYKDNQNIWQQQPNAKIIWLTPMNDEYNRQKLLGISTIRGPNNVKEYFVLKENTNSDPAISTHWISIAKLDSQEKMSSYILDNNLNFAPFGYNFDGTNDDKIEVVSDLGWVKQNEFYKDQYSVPFQYLLPNPEIVEGFNEGFGMKLFRENLQRNLTQQIKHLIDPLIWAELLEAIDYSFTNYGFAQGLTPPAAIDNLVIEKIIIGTFAKLSEISNKPSIQIFFTNLLTGIKKLILANSSNIDEQRQYLIQEIKKISLMIKLTTGSQIPETILNLINNSSPIELMDGLIGIINSIDFDKLFVELFAKVYNDSNRPKNQIVASGDYYPLIYKNIVNKSSFFNSFIKVIKALNISIPGIDIDWVSSLITMEDPAKGYVDLLNSTTMKYSKEYDSYYSSISLKQFLNMFNVALLGPLGNLIPESSLPKENDILYNRKTSNQLELDMDQLWYFDNYVFANGNGNILDLDSSSILNSATDSFTIIKEDDGQITYTENAAKIAIVNEAYLKANNKEVYTSNNLENELNDLSNIDNKYKISISNIEYVIVGKDITVDYMYPVINSENITVNVQNQALVYVNQYGYDRIKRSNINSPIDKYFLIQSKHNISNTRTQTELNQMVYRWMTGGGNISENNANSNSNNYKKAYLASESSLLNPERSLRLSVIDSLLSTLSNIQLYVGILLITLTSIVISFVVRRYISSRAKVLGILKAQGYSSLEIALSICLFPLIVSIIGGTLGYIAGHFSQYGILKLLSIFWTIPVASIGFNWMTLLITVIAPFILLSILTIIITLWFLRKKSLSLMNGSLEVNDSNFANNVKKAISKTSIKNRFSVSIALGSIGRLVALFISMLFTSTITLFAITTFRIFNKSVDKTFKEKKYTYKVDLITPTIEAGNYYDLKLNNENQTLSIDNMLYIPVGLPNEGYTYLSNYFKPGYNPTMNANIEVDGKLVPANGNLALDDTTTPHIFTKSSIDFTVVAGKLSINVWENLYNTIPESQRTSIINSSEKAAIWLQWTQEGNKINNYITRFMNFNDVEKEYLTLFDPQTMQNHQILNPSTNKLEDIKIPYFKYLIDSKNPEKSHFVYKSVLPENLKYYDLKMIINGLPKQNKIRHQYREFLVNGYNKMLNYDLEPNSLKSVNEFEPSKMPEFSMDYFIIPGASMLNNNFENNNSFVDETYIYVKTTNIHDNKIQPIINAYDMDSKFVKIIDANGANLLKKADEFNSSEFLPLIINEVSSQKYGLYTNDVIELEVNNGFRRYEDKLLKKLNEKPNNVNVFKFKIIGISDTYINEEWITNKKSAQKILNINNDINFYNGIFSKSNAPVQLVNSLGLYAYNGYWSAQESINVDKDYQSWSNSEKTNYFNIYQELFYSVSSNDPNKINNSLVAKNIQRAFKEQKNIDLTNSQINEKIKSLLSLQNNQSLDITENDSSIIYNALLAFVDIYTNKSLQSSLVNAYSNGVEKDYINLASNTINDGMLIVLTISFTISLTILIMITTMIINENERNIAIFGILGYSTKEKLRMFFSIYIPIVTISLLLSFLIVWLLLPAFSSAILSTSAIALPLGLSFIHILISSIIVIIIFTLTCISSWMIQGRIKPIILLKGV